MVMSLLLLPAADQFPDLPSDSVFNTLCPLPPKTTIDGDIRLSVADYTPSLPVTDCCTSPCGVPQPQDPAEGIPHPAAEEPPQTGGGE